MFSQKRFLCRNSICQQLRSPGSSRVKPPTRGMGRADLLQSRLQRSNEARLPGVKVSHSQTHPQLFTCELILFKTVPCTAVEVVSTTGI